MHFRFVSRLLASTLVCAGLTLAACSSDSSSTTQIEKSEIEKKAMAALSAKVGKASPPITCPGNMDAVVGKKMVCAVVLDDGKTYDVTVTITSVSGTTAEFSVEVASTPRP